VNPVAGSRLVAEPDERSGTCRERRDIGGIAGNDLFAALEVVLAASRSFSLSPSDW
jgi:hypothetical protein